MQKPGPRFWWAVVGLAAMLGLGGLEIAAHAVGMESWDPTAYSTPVAAIIAAVLVSKGLRPSE